MSKKNLLLIPKKPNFTVVILRTTEYEAYECKKNKSFTNSLLCECCFSNKKNRFSLNILFLAQLCYFNEESKTPVIHMKLMTNSGTHTELSND